MILCADDFGISPAVDDGILELIEFGLLSSTSCMIASLNKPTRFEKLKKFDGHVDLGLHLVFTDTKPIGRTKKYSTLVNSDGRFFKLFELIKFCYFGQLDRNEIKFEIEAQIQEFINVFGRPPDYIDGHQHIQLLPIIREQLQITVKSYPSIKYIRIANITDKWIWDTVKTGQVMPALGNLALRQIGLKSAQVFSKNGIAHNRFLLGYWNLSSKASFAKIFEEYLRINPTSEDIFFCHPGYIDDKLKQVDPLVDDRISCLQFLRSSQFTELCQSQNIILNRFGKPQPQLPP